MQWKSNNNNRMNKNCIDVFMNKTCVHAIEHHKIFDKSIHQVQDYSLVKKKKIKNSLLEFKNYCSSEEESEDEA